jgi:long-subunit acyl-CoA synthetase (AMP-forming)
MSWFDPPEPLLPELIALNGRWQASKAAVVDGDLVLSWTEFAAATARIAHGLAALGIAPQERIAVLMDTRAETTSCRAIPMGRS